MPRATVQRAAGGRTIPNSLPCSRIEKSLTGSAHSRFEQKPKKRVEQEGRKKRRQKVDIGLSSKKSFDPARSKTLTDEADAKRKQGLRSEAKSLYGQAIAANPSNGEAHLGLARVHFDLGSYHQARKSAEQAVKHSPRNGRAHKTLGDALFKEFHYQEAEAAYEEAQRLGVSVGNRLTEVRKKLGK